VANRAESIEAFRIAIVPSEGALEDKHYIAYNVSVGRLDSSTLTLGITMSAGDKIIVYSSTANISYSVFGTEIDF
jgi:hypothetical protein